MNGGCLCGAIRYATDATPFHETVCHCTVCRRASGAPFVAWFSVHPRHLSVSGTPSWFRSSAAGERGFCPRCGTQLLFRSAALPEEIDITTASLDDPSLVPPRDQVRTSTRVAWTTTVPALPAFPEGRTQEIPWRTPSTA
jgi:hypothetical protein